jgi:tRNA threonylcarbamoyladenosine biosynthesis protein TsaE
MTVDTYITASSAETEALGERLAARLSQAPAVALIGDLGAGKTTFTRGLARGLGCTLAATSPTYTLVNEYPGPRKVCHFDMYRLGGPDDLWEIGWDDYLASGAFCVVEWSERAEGALPVGTARVRFTRLGDDSRKIEVTLCDASPGAGGNL